MSLISRLLTADGVHWKSQSGTEWKAHCFAHEDSTPSLSVDITKGVYHCFGCGVSGNAYTYLTEQRGYGKQEAVRYMVEEGEWDDRKVDQEVKAHTKRREDSEAKELGLPVLIEKIPEKYRRLALFKKHNYVDEDGRLTLVVVRYEGLINGKRQKSFLQVTPASRGGWWRCNPLNDAVPAEDKPKKGLIPLFNVRNLISHPGKMVWFVEGEKCALILHQVALPGNKDKPFVPVSLAGGSNAKISNFDLTPIRGRKVLLLADGDKPGRNFMSRLGKILEDKYDCTAKYVLPPGENGYDIGDVVARQGWQSGLEWIKQHTKEPTREPTAEETKHEEPKETEDFPLQLTDTEHFRVIGYDQSGTNVMILKKKVNVVLSILATRLNNEGVLTQLAPLKYWRDWFDGSFSSANRTVIADGLLRAADRLGMVDQALMTPLGRGALKTPEGQVLYNLGDKYLKDVVNGVFTGTGVLEMAPVLLQPGAPIVITSDLNKAEHYSREFYAAIMECRFLDPIHGRRYLGWLVSALVGGALPFRPMLWLTAPARSGKTYLRDNIAMRFFGNFRMTTDDSTAAGIAQEAGNQSIPVLFDEFEPEENTQGRWNEVLGLIRSATGGGGQRVRGTLSGRAVATQPRFSALLMSIAKPRLTEANASRLITCKLSSVNVPDWDKVEEEIERTCTKERMSCIRSAVIKNTPTLVGKVNELRSEFKGVEGMDQRARWAHAALTAGAGFLSGDYESTWMQSSREDSSYDLLKYIFACRVKMTASREYTVATLLSRTIRAMISADPDEINDGLAYDHLAQAYGLRVFNDDRMGHPVLLVAYETPELHKLLANSPFGRYVSVKDMLLQIPEVELFKNKEGKLRRMTFADQQRASLYVPAWVLQQSGLDMKKIASIEDDGLLEPPQSMEK